MQYVLLAFVVVLFSFVYGRIWLRRHRETPLRRELRARNATFRAVLKRVTVITPGWSQQSSGDEMPIKGPMELIVRGGDAFEVSCPIPPLRMFMGLEYYFRASETSVELNRLVPRIYGPRIYGADTPPRIILRGWQAGKKIQLTITQKDDPLEIWNVLTAAGAVPGITWIAPAVAP
jgi:hypothetical protein